MLIGSDSNAVQAMLDNRATWRGVVEIEDTPDRSPGYIDLHVTVERPISPTRDILMNPIHPLSSGFAATLLAAALASPAAAERAFEVGPLWDQAHADEVCPAVALSHGAKWTGQWWTTVEGEISVCELRQALRAVEVGPIWDQAHAETVCPAVARSHGADWTGEWWTTVEGQMSVCQLL